MRTPPLLQADFIHTRLQTNLRNFLDTTYKELVVKWASLKKLGNLFRPCLKNKSCTKGQDMSN